MCSDELHKVFPTTQQPKIATASSTPNCYTDLAELSFRKCLDLIRQPWVRAFLLPSQTNYLEQIRQTLLQPLRVTARMTMKTLTPLDELSFDEQIRLLLLPSFSTGGVSVCYMVIHYFSTTNCARKQPFIARCVRDDVNGIFLTVAELPRTRFTELTFCAQYSPGFRDHVAMVLNTERFREAMGKLPQGYDPEMMKSALAYSFKSCEIRECPTCGKLSVSCACPLRLVRKKHPMDFGADLHNLGSYMGSYEGFSHQTFYEAGINRCNGLSSMRASVQFSYDSDGRRQLESWAFQHTLRGRSMNLMNLTMPASDTKDEIMDRGDEGTPPASFGSIANGDIFAWSEFSDQVAEPAGQTEYSLSDGIALEMFTEELPDPRSNLDDVTDMQKEDIQTISSTVEEENQERDDPTSPGDSTASSDGQESTFEEVTEVTRSMAKTQHPQVLPVPCALTTPAAPSHSVCQPRDNPALKPRFGQDAITRPKRMGRPPAPKIRPVTKLVPIFPATKVTAAANVQNAAHIFSEVAKRKVELRKARNRASAIRSNEKKKKQMRELQENLALAKKREAVLRSKDRLLRRANLELRGKLSGSLLAM